jgi:hypothetical protein
VSETTSIPLTPQARRLISEALENFACNPSLDMRKAREMEELAGYVLGNLKTEEL